VLCAVSLIALIFLLKRPRALEAGAAERPRAPRR
jgi:hypothetical protein